MAQRFNLSLFLLLVLGFSISYFDNSAQAGCRGRMTKSFYLRRCRPNPCFPVSIQVQPETQPLPPKIPDLQEIQILDSPGIQYDLEVKEPFGLGR